MSSESLKSLIVTDPDLVDPELDVSGLRTQTDTDPRLLASIADFPGISYDPTQFSYLTDLNELFAYGLPMVDTPTASNINIPLPGGGGSGGGGNVSATMTAPSANTPEEQRLIDAGIGVQGAPGDPVVAPGEIPVTQDELDAFNQIPVTPVGGQPIDPTGMLPQIPEVVAQDPTTMLPQTGSISPTFAEGTATLEDAGAGEGGMQLAEVGLGDEADFTPLSTYDEAGLQIAEAPFGINPATGEPYQTPRTIADQNRVLGQTFDTTGLTDATPEQKNIIQNILTAAGDNVQGALTELGKIPGAIVDFANQTVDVFGKKLNVGKTLAGAALNKLVGGPATLIFELAENILPEGNIAPSTNLARSTGLLQGDNTVTQDIYGINTQTSFDPVQSTKNYNEYNVKQVEKLENRLEELRTDKYKDDFQAYLDNTKRMRQELKDRKEYLTIAGVGGDVDERDQMLDDIVLQNKIDEGIQTADDDKGSDMLDTATGVNPFKDIDTGVREFDTGTNIVDEVALTGGDEFSDEAFMVGDTSTAAPTTGDSGADSFFDAVDTATGGGGGRDRDPDPSPSFDPGQGFVDTGGGGEFETGPVSTFSAEEEDEIGDDRGGGGGDPGGGPKGCVIATHAVNSGAFTKDTKREAVRWCVKNLHRTWWGEAIRRGYRYYGQKAIEEGKAKNHYQEFKDYIAFGTGKRRTLKTGWTFVYRSIQFFIRGLISGQKISITKNRRS